MRAACALFPALVAVALLAGCVQAPVLTVTAAEIADTAETALEQQIGSRPTMDCGTDDVELRKGETVDCILTDPETGENFEAPVTIAKVEGTEYSISVRVAQSPITP